MQRSLAISGLGKNLQSEVNMQITRIRCEKCGGDGRLADGTCERCKGDGYYIPTKRDPKELDVEPEKTANGREAS